MYKKFCIYIALFIIFTVSKAFPAEKAILVTQPAYHSMNFYVYKPANVPNEFYATYDGYLIYKNAHGIWNYASAEKTGIKKTGYVVGSVIPSVVKLKPYDTKISSVSPILQQDTITIKPVGTRISSNEIISVELNSPELLEIDVTPANTPQIAYIPPSNKNINSLYNATKAVEWTQNSNFMAISKWQKSVDRIGVLDIPKTPIAWKGDYPEVIYAWNGMQWQQISARNKHVSALNIIRRENYNLVVHTNKLNVLNWNDDDSYILAQYATFWGYKWLGQISINNQ